VGRVLEPRLERRGLIAVVAGHKNPFEAAMFEVLLLLFSIFGAGFVLGYCVRASRSRRRRHRIYFPQHVNLALLRKTE
jgi:hypothetical protein